MFSVQYVTIANPTVVTQTTYETLAEAVAVARVLIDSGQSPTLIADDFSAFPNGAGGWSMRFKAAGCFKSLACILAEREGVRYVSHRRGYQASNLAFRRFCHAYREAHDAIAGRVAALVEADSVPVIA